MAPAPLFLTSLVFDGLAAWLDQHAGPGPVAVIGNAGRTLDDGEAIAAMGVQAVTDAGRVAETVDVLHRSVQRLDRAAALVMTGGDPFRLLADLRESGADGLLTAAHARGLPIAGQSAGAIVQGPDLESIRITSPFAAPTGLNLTGLGLTARLVLPHHGRPQRSELHRQAAAASPDPSALFPLWDDEVLLESDTDDWRIRRGGWTTRPARPEDAPAVARLFHESARQAWSTFLEPARLAAAPLDIAAWTARIRAAGNAFLVTEDHQGIAAFSRILPEQGEVDLLYTHPRASGQGLARRLLERATWTLLCVGHVEAVLWTEARNTRARAVYEANGWRRDGGIDERDYLGTPIRNERFRLDLRRFAGGR